MRASSRLLSVCRPLQASPCPPVAKAQATAQYGVRPSPAAGEACRGKSFQSGIFGLSLVGTVGGVAAGLAASASSTGSEPNSEAPSWTNDMALEPGMERAGSPGQILSSNPVAKMVVEKDHLFEAMTRVGMVKGIECFYNHKNKEFHAAIKLGRDVCGYPSTVHGGLTAAIIDETLGGLMLSLWRSGAIGLLPAVTARLEVDYCKKVPQNSSVLCSTHLELIEGRKLWMTAEVRDKPDGIVYATARGLFIVPSVGNLIGNWVSGFWKTKDEGTLEE